MSKPLGLLVMQIRGATQDLLDTPDAERKFEYASYLRLLLREFEDTANAAPKDSIVTMELLRISVFSIQEANEALSDVGLVKSVRQWASDRVDEREKERMKRLTGDDS